jgi:hypothetical protein
MSEKEVPVSERIKILFQHFGDGNLSAFAREISVSAQAIRDLMKGEKGGPSWPVLQNILRAFPSISTDWLVLGKGKMLRQEAISVDIPDLSLADLDSVKKHVSDVYNAHIKDDITASLREMDEQIKQVSDKAIQQRIDEDARYTIYSVIGTPNPGQPYDGLLTTRLGIPDEEAIRLVNEGDIEAWYVGRWKHHTANWRTSELHVRRYLSEASKALVKKVE